MMKVQDVINEYERRKELADEAHTKLLHNLGHLDDFKSRNEYLKDYLTSEVCWVVEGKPIISK